MKLHFGVAPLVIGLSAMVTVSGQVPTSTARPGSGADADHRPSFEVASVKPNKLGRNAIMRVSLRPGDRVTMTDVLLLTLIQIAYPGASEIIGGPKWMGTAGTPNFDADRFDVNAKAESPSSVDQLRLMLQTLLAERFKLVVHTETRQKDVYALRLAREDGRLGPNLHHADLECRALVAADPSPTPSMRACGTVGTDLPPWHLRGVAISQLLIFRNELGRPIVDKTGLIGPFDFDLNWTPRWALDPSVDRGRWPGVDFAGPDIFTAIQEQLGLKFVAEKDEQSVLVIDHVEQPASN